MKYFVNCFLLIIPILLWNVFLYDYLPGTFSSEILSKDIPVTLTYGEWILRILVFGLPFVMVLSIKSRREKMGFILYCIGTIIYFMSWLALIFFPASAWSESALGFTAPAYSTIIWLIGIGIIGHASFIKMKSMSAIYITTAILFVIFHTARVYWIYDQLA